MFGSNNHFAIFVYPVNCSSAVENEFTRVPWWLITESVVLNEKEATDPAPAFSQKGPQG